MKKITNKYSIQPVPMTTYNTFEDTISAAKKIEKERIAEIKNVEGMTIEECYYNWNKLSIKIGGSWLLIKAKYSGVEWDLSKSQTRMDKLQINSPVEFIYPSGSIYVWDWREIVKSIINQKIVLVGPGEGLLNLGIQNKGDLLFLASFVENDKENLVLTFNWD
ncbi:MAG: hypothetical protein PVF82_18745 [Gammaproteobacteria bacterium]|jgi:hypothetical protein